MSDNLLAQVPAVIKRERFDLTPAQMKFLRDPRFLAEVVKPTPMDRTHDVPYVAGVSATGNKVYIDRHLQTNNHGHSITPYLMVHERVEWTLMHVLGLKYPAAHKIATEVERKMVELGGTMPWRSYQAHYRKYIKHDNVEKLVNPPADLDLVPYKDSHDFKHVKQLMRNGKP